MAYRGAEGTRMYEKGGLVYNILNEQGEPMCIPVKPVPFTAVQN